MESDPLFPLGPILITPGAEALLSPGEIEIALGRHQSGDWGEIHPEDQHQNHRGMKTSGMIMSVFKTASGAEFWIQTHGTRSHTTILQPGE